MELKGIASGIENTNYFVTTTTGKYVLTLVEKIPAVELPYYLNLMAHLAHHGIPCPSPIADIDDAYLGELNGKPACIVTRLAGASLERPDGAACAQVGALLANMHLAGRSYHGHMDNPRGPRWWKDAAPAVMPKLSAADATRLADEIRYQSLYRFADLPRGVIHADLFKDNVLFDGARLSGVIDFYYACNDSLLYDLAITVNDWCFDAEGGFDISRMATMMAAYHVARPLLAIERGAWPVMLRAAALRFWLSRLLDFHFPRDGELTHAKDPEHFRRILQYHIDNEPALKSAWV